MSELAGIAERYWIPVVAGFFLLLSALEGRRPGAAGFSELAPRWGVNFGCWLLGSWAVGALPAGAWWSRFLGGGHPYALVDQVAGGAAAAALALIALDLLVYLTHRLHHAWHPLWRLHAVHHADLRVDASTAFRHHPAEAVTVALLLGIAVGTVGIPAHVMALYAILALGWALLQHADLELPFVDRALSPVLMTPALHRLHHSADPADHGANLGQILSLWDRLFGTLRPAPQQPFAFGIGVAGSHRPWAALLLPIRLPHGDAPEAKASPADPAATH